MAKRGRKSLQEEAVKADVINMSWHTLRRMLVSENVSEEAKQKVALEICKKTCPQEVVVDGDIEHTHRAEEVDIQERINQVIGSRISSASN